MTVPECAECGITPADLPDATELGHDPADLFAAAEDDGRLYCSGCLQLPPTHRRYAGSEA